MASEPPIILYVFHSSSTFLAGQLQEPLRGGRTLVLLPHTGRAAAAFEARAMARYGGLFRLLGGYRRVGSGA